MAAAKKGVENWKVPKSFRLDRQLDERLAVRAEREGRSKSAVVSDAIEAYLDGAPPPIPEEDKERASAYVRERGWSGEGSGVGAREALERVRKLNAD